MIFDSLICNKDINFLIDRIELSIKILENEKHAYVLKNYIRLATKHIKRKYPQEYNCQIRFLLIQFEFEIDDYLTRLKYSEYLTE